MAPALSPDWPRPSMGCYTEQRPLAASTPTATGPSHQRDALRNSASWQSLLRWRNLCDQPERRVHDPGSFTVQRGPADGYGTVFQITSTGTLTTLHSFDSSDGAHPSCTLLQGTDGNFYGTTYSAQPASPSTARRPSDHTRRHAREQRALPTTLTATSRHYVTYAGMNLPRS